MREGVFFDEPRCGSRGPRCATEDYLVTFTRVPANIDLFGQIYQEVVSTVRPFGMFCDKQHSDEIRRQKQPERFGDSRNTILDIVGIMGDRDLIDQEKINLVRMAQRPLKCGVELLQYFKINGCRVPRDRSKSIRQRSQFLLDPAGTILFGTSRSDEKIPHVTLTP